MCTSLLLVSNLFFYFLFFCQSRSDFSDSHSVHTQFWIRHDYNTFSVFLCANTFVVGSQHDIDFILSRKDTIAIHKTIHCCPLVIEHIWLAIKIVRLNITFSYNYQEVNNSVDICLTDLLLWQRESTLFPGCYYLTCDLKFCWNTSKRTVDRMNFYHEHIVD